jgi:hypothetical protein
VKMAAFWVVMPGSLVEVYCRFRGTCFLRRQGDSPEDNNLHSRCVRTTIPTAMFFFFLR